ncbi:PREDICTED: alpha-tocopherol transfer protein [Papilio polytes]|uniref:alpha-tocopherol transfer protein n=1 Tax=Papilio polytes TaxID=76194 RepID=UPI0006763333|nr:PREDICTED: alpha-tocopherol transfer protein [Papilio polytes]
MADTKTEEPSKVIEHMRNWVNSQPHLPKDIEDWLLLRFAHSCYYDLEKAKVAADLFFTLRAESNNLLKDRDPQSTHMQKILSIINIAQLKLPGMKNIWIYQINDPGLDVYEYILDVKLFFTSTDAWLLDNDDLEDSDTVIIDVKDISLKFLTKFNVSIARKLSKYQEEAIPIRLKQVHIVNAPPFIDKIYGLMKPFLKKELTEMIHFHPPNSESLYKHVTRDELPADYGGTFPKMEDLNKSVVQLMMKHRERLNENLWVATDKKSKNKDKVQIETASFRSLAID